jgi:hypothetical protein
MKFVKFLVRNFKLSLIILFILILATTLLFVYSKHEFKISLSTLSFSVVSLSFLFVIISYDIKALSEKNRSIILLKKQLEIIGEWTSYREGGYHKWDQEKTQVEAADSWGNPFHNIFNSETSALSQVIVLPGTYKLSDEIIENLVMLNQEITSFNNYIADIRSFKYSRDSYKNIILHLKIGSKKYKSIKNLLKRSKINSEIDGGEEDAFRTKLIELYSGLHFDLIGDEFTKRLFYRHKKTYESVIEKEKWIQGKI